MRRLIALALTLAGIALLVTTPSHSQAATAPTRLTIVTEGAAKGPAVLMLPGLASSRSVFDTEARILAPMYRLYRVQLNGFGGQPAGPNASGPILSPVVEELHQYIVANHLHPAVIGHSMGGLLGLMLADAHPEDVQKLLIVDSLPFYALVFNQKATVATMRPQAQMIHDQMLHMPDAEFIASVPSQMAYMVNDPEGRKAASASALSSDRATFANAMQEDMTTDIRARLASIKTPSTLLYPFDAAAVGNDTTSVDNVYKTAYATMPNLTTHRIENSRHFIMYDQPAAFDAQVQTFLK